MKKTIAKYHIGLILAIALLLSGQNLCLGAVSAKWLPDETLVLLSAENVNELRAKFKLTSTYALYKDPAMQAFMVPAEQKICRRMDEGIKELWTKLGLEAPPKEIPWPQGQVMVAFFIQPRTTTMTDCNPVDDTIEAPPLREVTVPDFQVVGLAQMGDKLAGVQQLFQQVASQAVEKGLLRQREKVRGVEITIIKDKPEVDENYDTLCYGFKDDWLIVGSSLKYIKEVIVRMTDTTTKTLADNRDFKDMQQALGNGEVNLFLNGQRMIEVVKAVTPPAEQAKIAQTIETLGLTNTSGVGMTVQLAPSKNEEVKIKMLLGVRGEKKGIPALLTPDSDSLRPNRLLSKGLAGFLTANYDIGKIYNGIVQMVWEIGQVNLDGMLQGAMMMTGTPGEGGQTPVDVKKEVLGQLTSPITIATRITKPYTEPDSSQMLWAIAVRNTEILDTAVSRIHNTFIAQGKPELRRELAGATIYLLPTSGLASMMLPWRGMAGPNAAKPVAAGFAVVGDQLVIGAVSGIEQAIRNLGRADFESIKADPMFQYASRALPSQAGTFSYGNEQISTEAMWVQFKEASKQRAASGTENTGSGASAAFAYGPMGMFVEELDKYCDFTLLPEFEQVKKYFGVSVGHVVGTEKGIYAEMTGLKPPK